MNPSPEQILKEAHTQWLTNPVTQQFIRLLKDREELYKDCILESVLKESNTDYQNKVRANLSSINTILKIATETDTFVELSTNKPKTTD